MNAGKTIMRSRLLGTVFTVVMKRPIVFVLLLLSLPAVSSAEWSIGVYVGTSPLDVVPPNRLTNPVLTADDVTDLDALFVADPFLIREDGTWYMFFEVYNHQGDIGYATSNDGMNWAYQRVVIDEAFHMSYPYVFEWQGDYYLVPETHEANAIRLYKAVNFPTQWSFIGNMLIGAYRDPSLFRSDDKWWLFTTEGATRDDTLQLFYADDLLGPWQEHPLSPVVQDDPNIARPGGRVTQFDGRLIRYAQDDFPTYGNKVRAFEIVELSTTTYRETDVAENPILDGDGLGWNADGMHHIDPHQLSDGTWLAAVDGNGDPNQLDFYGFWLSDSTDRTDSKLLDDGVIVRGDEICVYVQPEVDIDQVTFFLDGSLQQVEQRAPFDFAGTGTDQACNLYDTINLTLGDHTLSAEIEFFDGTMMTIESTLQVSDTGPTSKFELLCSNDAAVNGTDPDCSGGEFPTSLWIYLWPEADVDSVDFYLDGVFRRTERWAPYELDGGAMTQLTSGTHTVHAVVHLASGGSEEVSATFTVGTPAAYVLLCSPARVLDGTDATCDGGNFNRLSHPAGIWVYLWPEDRAAIDYVDYRLNGILLRRENIAPWELLGGAPLPIPASQMSYTVTSNLGLFSGDSQPGPAVLFVYGP